MTEFSKQVLDDIRARVKVSEIVGHKNKLQKVGKEFRVADNHSLTINDDKQLWWDHASNEGGDIFTYLTKIEGQTFPDAVKTCASIAGIRLEGDAKPNGYRVHGAAAQGANGADTQDAGAEPPRKMAATYDYTDETGELVYQVVRFEPKDFRQRRPDGHGGWIWSLKDVKPLFYRLPEVLEALAEERPVYITEGEKDADTLWEWGVPATTNSGGAKHWGKQDLSVFASADVVVALDNDDAGRARADIIGASLTGTARRVRALDLSAHWPGAPKGADVTDWRDNAQGNVDALLKITKELPDWKPAPAPSKFGRVRWGDQDRPQVSEYQWWIKGLVPKGQTVAVIGPMGCGKSFETFNLGMHIAMGKDYRGHRTQPGLVVFCAPEGGAGILDRMRAYRNEHALGLDGIPFEAMTRRFNLFASDDDINVLIAEIKGIAADYKQELALVVIDTWSAATTGLDENSSKDVSLVRSRIVRLQTECNCGVMFVHHMNAGGERQRGHSSITADVESVLEIKMVTRWENKQQVQVTDENNRDIRRIMNKKQREGASGQHWDFVLEARTVRKDADGDNVTSCVSALPAREGGEVAPTKPKRARDVPKGEGFHLFRDGEVAVFKAVIAALEATGEPPAPQLKLPPSIKQVVRWADVAVAYKNKVPSDEGDTPEGQKRYLERVKKALNRARTALLDFSVIGIDKTPGEHGYHVVWPTGKKVWGNDLNWPPVAPKGYQQGDDDFE